jgi:hypothetical protein
MLDHSREIVGVVIEIVPVADLRRTTMSPPVMRYYAIALTEEEQHLRVPVITRKRPAMAEHDGLTRTPILVKNLNAAFCLNCGHEITLSLIYRSIIL